MDQLKGIEFKFDDLDVDLQGDILALGIVVILKKFSLVLLLILCVAMLLWFNKLTIFITVVQFILVVVTMQIQRFYYKKAVKQLLKEDVE
ncbi:hypothetical protein IGI66_000236 [Enterococcus sp. AZ048]|uniref:hypothetical protein n=1 Tax=Enterococcus sp. AZ048 TaxID=2774658 RepID=UPI003F22E8AA